MTNRLSEYGTNTLDISVDSIQIRARKGEDLIFEYDFTQPDTSAAGYVPSDPSTWTYVDVDVSGWTFSGGVRPQTSADISDFDIVNLASPNTNTIQVFLDTTVLPGTIPANSSADFYFEIQATIPTSRVKSDGTNISVRKTVLTGIITLNSDVYTPSA